MTYEELRRLARQTNWEKSRTLFQVLKKVLEIMDEEDYVNGYVKHLFNDENDMLDIYIVTSKEKLIVAKYLHPDKTIQLKILDIAAIDEIDLLENTDGTMELSIAFNSGYTIHFNSRENYDHEHKNHIPDFLRSLYNS
ncbi:MAG: DUF3908 family protein [Bacillota bacterium]|nr:DUF3908 family protein [Bacillota bacterium]MDW7683855.1 DUF3908 family protein [Bacillota bacterium]